MQIAYVTMQFPVPSEAFAAVEVRALRRQGAAVCVLAYRAAPPDAAAMLADRGLADLPVQHGGAAADLRGLMLTLMRPADSLWLAAEILRRCSARPVLALKALSLVPRSLALLRYLETNPPVVLHLFWGHFPSLLGLLVRRRLPGVVLSQFLGAYDLERSFPLSAVLARQADCLVTHAKANLKVLEGLDLPAKAVHVSYRGVDVPRPLPDPAKTRGLMVVAERLVPQKRTADAIHVFAAVHSALPETRLVICGSGPEAAHLRALVKSLDLDHAVRFAGHVPHSEMLDLLGRAEICLSLSRSSSERLPNVIKEAMLRRCLCLSSRTAGIGELIDDGVSGIIVDVGDVDAAALRLRTALNDPAAIEGYGRRAQEKIALQFDADRLMADRLKLWSDLARTRRRDAAA